MTSTGEEAPGLELDPGTVRALTTAATTIAGVLRDRRLAADRWAWSDPEAAARRHDVQERAADPSVRSMAGWERAAWDRAEPESRRVDGPTGSVTVAVADLGGRWGLFAEGAAGTGERVMSTYVSCVDEATAKRVADELLAAGPVRVGELDQYAAMAARQAEAAGAGVREPEAQRLARTAGIVRQVWNDELGEKVTSSRAFGAFAWRLRQGEESGYAMLDMMRWLERRHGRRLRASDVRDPAQLGEYFLEKRLSSLQPDNLADNIIDLDNSVAFQAGPASPNAARAGSAVDEAAAARKRAAEQELAKHRAAADPLLAAALPADVAAKVQDSRGYASLVKRLHDLQESGQQVEPMLTNLPVERIAAADNPGIYLGAVVRGRAENASEVRRSGVDRVRMALLVQEGLPDQLAERVLNDKRGWPKLAQQLAEGEREGRPVVETLRGLPAGLIHRRMDKPAAYVGAILTKQRTAPNRLPAGPDRDTTQGVGPHQQGPAAADAARGDPPRPDLGWVEHLDPQRPVDRVGLEASLGLGSVSDDEYILQVLNEGPPPQPEETVAPPGPEEAPVRAELDKRAAAQLRAAEAEQVGAETAAAQRAALTYTPDDRGASEARPGPQHPRPRPSPRPRTVRQEQNRGRGR